MKLGLALKRAIDIGAAAGGLLIAAPAMAAIAVAIVVDSPGGVLFAQERIGRHGRVFKLLKFRTMKHAPIRFQADGSTRIDPDDDRITRVGRYLRGALDELPQLINVLRGEMSLVGPRPEMASQRDMYTPDLERKLDVLPGLTSLAIVLGRSTIPWRERVEIDLRYIDQWSLWLDARILICTALMPLGFTPFTFSDVVPTLRGDHA